ncbi:MAG TPA: transglycosylase SLT domain-containing protein [Kofleriaceae bacterium]|jgi:soluble lytic murein transglycosylase
MRLALSFVALACACSGDDTRRAVPTTVASGSAGDARVAAMADAAAPEQAGALSDSLVQSYWKTADELDGAARFAAHDYENAKQAFERARAAVTDATAPQAARLELMLGLCDAELGNHDDAAAHLAAASRGLPTIADYIKYREARSLWLAHHDVEALSLAREVAPDSIVAADTAILIGDLMAANSDHAELAKYYGDYLDHHPSGPFRSEARFHLAEALPDRAAQIKVLREIEIEDPLSSWAAKAHARLVVLKATPEKFTAAEDIARGMVLFDGMRNPESEAAFTAALATKKLEPDERCVAAYHAAQSRFKARDRKGAAPMFDEALQACRAAKNTDLEVKSEYQAGRSYAYIGEHETAIERYRAAQKIDPKHSYADDAMLREAEEWSSLNDGAQVEAVLSALPTTFPDGDNAVEAMWRLGWRSWREQRYDDAIKWWKQQLAVVPAGKSYDGVFGDDSRAEATYWLGRAYAAKQQLPDAIAAWQDCARKYPAAYYAMQSLNRLRENAPQRFQQTVTEISADPAGYDPKAPAFAFKARAAWQAPGFARAMELVRLGLGEPAGQELRKLGLVAPGDKKAATDADELDKLWAVAWLDDRADRWAQSVWATRWHALDYRASWPTGANRARWQIAYPKGYWDLLAKHAALNHVPIAMQIAIVREESGFDPLDESYANAIGLTQMIPPTAKDFSKGTGIDPTRENLRDPEKNVTIGSRFLGSLFKDWNNFTLLVPTSYNAGPAAVRRMLRVRGTWDADEFVEGIVDDQARNYTKRVLGSFFTYTWLYEHVVPEIPLKIPQALLPK